LTEQHAVPPAQETVPAWHTKPQDVPSHVAVAFTGTAHGEQEAPQVSTLAELAQAPPHAW